METATRVLRPFPFRREDLDPDRIGEGVRQTLDHYFHWRDGSPGVIASHVDGYTEQLRAIMRGHTPAAAALRGVWPPRRRRELRDQAVRELNYFGVYNLSEVPDPADVARAERLARVHARAVRDTLAAIERGRGPAGVVEALERRFPGLRGVLETRWLLERLDRLHRCLPETVVRAGAMGKVVRTLVGVLAIGAYDTRDAGRAATREHLTRILPGAYAYGAAYAIVDDSFQDLRGEHLPQRDRDRLHRLVLRGLSTGAPVDRAEIPDHPLAEELHELYGIALRVYPFSTHRHLYQAAESMYLAQHRDAARDPAEPLPDGLESAYPDIFLKAGLSRVVANILGRREVDEGFYARCLNTIFLSQFKDDLADRDEDRRAGRMTPFTHPGDGHTNPLHDLFAYDAYVVDQVFGGDPVARDALTGVGAVKLATHLCRDPRRTLDLLDEYPATAEIAAFLRTAAAVPRRVQPQLTTGDLRLKREAAAIMGERDPNSVDARTFVLDRLDRINELVHRCHTEVDAAELAPILAYTMDGPAKRLRPALTLMLAEGLGVKDTLSDPLLGAIELFHTASLIFDDLPAQDDATLRRGRPAAHTVFDEGSVQLAAISMLSSGFGMLARLDRHYPADRVTDVVAYVGTVLGPQRLCRGQYLDLRFARDARPVTGEDILEMYRLKTSTMVEAALVPLMMLLGRPRAEIELVTRYADHAGVVFQARDDILDATATADQLGKDAGADLGKANLVRVYGLPQARRLMAQHRDEAVACLHALPFDTRLLEGIVDHFATRNH
ncbi:polyprenyl synthetase family protein [Catellatospora sp. NPDC049609]|uniref:polyprenyl synthetase family protein n=1 Tax=Catellatospora sp. NPDC049609 TaxID=3155505 RepID=UPI003432997E